MGRIRLLFRLIVVLVVAAGLVASGREILPAAAVAWSWIAAADDPVALARLELGETLTAERVASEIDAAVAADDLDLARSFVALAGARGLVVDADRLAAIRALEAEQGWKAAKSFARGALVGDADGLSGVAGALTADVVGIGDVRDLVREGWHAARGEPVDELLVGLSAVGLAVTGATWVLAGTPAPVRAGLTLVKGARRAGRLSAPLAASIGASVRAAVDLPALQRAMGAVGKLDITAARTAAKAAVRTDRLGPLVDMGEDAATLYRRGGLGAVDQTLALARNGDEVRRAAKLAEAFGDGTRATLKVLGRSAIVLSRGLAHLVGWLMAAIGWALSVASAAAAFGRWLARVTPPHPRRRRAAVGAEALPDLAPS